MTDAVIIQEPAVLPDTGYKFSWGLAIAGGVIAVAVTFFLLTLGAGFGLMLVSPLSNDNPSLPTFLTGGAIYFLAAQAFGFAVGGHIAGTLLGPVVETNHQEKVRAASHGFVAWAVSVLATVTMVALGGLVLTHGGMTAGAVYGASSPTVEDKGVTGYVVDKLFRPTVPAAAAATTPGTYPAPVATTPARPAAENAAAHNEAGRIVDRTILLGQPLAADDKTRLIALTSEQAGISVQEASTRVDATQTEVTTKAKLTADVARKTASYSSLWIAASLLFGALVAMLAAVNARIEDDKHELRAMGRATVAA